MLHSLPKDSFSSESQVSSEDGAVSEFDDSAASAQESIASATRVLSPREYPEGGILLCRNWSGPTHPVRPCQPLAADAPLPSFSLHVS